MQSPSGRVAQQTYTLVYREQQQLQTDATPSCLPYKLPSQAPANHLSLSFSCTGTAEQARTQIQKHSPSKHKERLPSGPQALLEVQREENFLDTNLYIYRLSIADELTPLRNSAIFQLPACVSNNQCQPQRL